MNENSYSQSIEPDNILRVIMNEHIGILMSHLSKGKWHITKVDLVDVGTGTLRVEVAPQNGRHPINVQIDQPVGVSFKYRQNKYIFESPVVGFEPAANAGNGGTIVLQMPERVDVMSKRHYFRVDVPSSLKVNVLFWHRGYYDSDSKEAPQEGYWQGRLLDVSAGGVQVEIGSDQSSHFKTGQLIGMQFTPLPYERPIMLEGRIRRVAMTQDGTHCCLGAQIVGLEATVDGREILKRLCGTVEQYNQINTNTAKEQLNLASH